MKRFLVLMLVFGLLVSLYGPARADEKETGGEEKGAVEKVQEAKEGSVPRKAEQIRGRRGTGERRNFPMRPGMGREMPPGLDMEGRQGREMPRMGFEQRIDAMNRQIEQRKKEHEDFVQELRAIQEIAKEEKAKKTAKHLETLIAKREKAFNKSIVQIKKRQEAMQKQMMRRRQDRTQGESDEQGRPRRGRLDRQRPGIEGRDANRGKRRGGAEAAERGKRERSEESEKEHKHEHEHDEHKE